MELLQLRTNGLRELNHGIPFTVYTVGTELQQPITRLEGFSANQLLIVFSGTGRFRRMDQNNWDIVGPGSFLFIPARTPSEYMPMGDEPWFVGYVTYLEQGPGMLSQWGFGDETIHCTLIDLNPFYQLIRQIWLNSGPDQNAWRCSEFLFAFCLELKKQLHIRATSVSEPNGAVMADEGRNAAVNAAVQFMHDHLERRISIAELAAYVGYSQKHLTRLFRDAMNMTPLQYLLQIRLRTAAVLLNENPRLTIRQAAAFVGMEPVYFARIFRRAYGRTPSEVRRSSVL